MKKLKQFLILIITLGLGAYLFIAVVRDIGLDTIISGFKMLEPSWVLVALILFFAISFIDTLRWKIILNAYDIRPKFRHLLSAKYAGFCLSYLTPIFYVGGEGLRAMILKRRSGVKVSCGMRTIVVDKVIEGLILCLLLVFSGGLMLVESTATIYLVLAGLMVFVGLLGIILLGWQVNNDKNIFRAVTKILKLDKIRFIKNKQKKIESVENEVYEFFSQHSQVFLRAIALSALSVFIYIILFKFILFALGIEISLLVAILIRSLAIIITLIPIPAALGVFEGSFSYAFEVLGIGRSWGVNFSFMMRFFYALWVILGLLSLSRFGISVIRNKLRNAKTSK